MADGDLKWTYATGGDASNQTPAIDSRGVIYLYPEGSILYAIKPDGSLLWSRNVGANDIQPLNNVVVDYNGSIYVMNHVGLVTALYPDNTVIWTYNTAEISYGGLSVDKSGVVYALSYTKITAINTDGTEKWNVSYINGTFYTPASIDNNGNVYASQWGWGTVCIDSDGNEKWKREFWDEDVINPFATPAISTDGNTIYVSGETHNSNNVLLALDASDGSTTWAFEIVSVFVRHSYSSPAIDSNNIIYVGFNDNTVRAINPDGTEKWSIIISGNHMAHYSSPTIASNGNIYFIDYRTLYALSPEDGSVIWSYPGIGGNAVYTSPAIAQDGTIYFGARDNKLYAIEESSPPLKDYRNYYTGIDQCYPSLWRSQVDLYQQWITPRIGTGASSNLYSPTIDRDGIIYVVGYNDKKLYAFNNDGSEKWSYTADEYTNTPPSIDNSNNIYFGTRNGYVYKLDSDGNFVWKFSVDGLADVWMQPSIDNNGVVYIGDENGIFYAINSDGTEKWRYTAGASGMYTHAAALSLSGFVCFGDYNNFVYTLNISDGSEIWKYNAGDDIDSSPVIDSNDIVYIGSYDGVVHAIKTDGTNKWTYNIGDNIYFSNAVLSSDESVLYIGAYDDVLYAINTNDGSLKWSYAGLYDIDSSANIRVDGKIYIVDNKYLHVINPDDGSLIWRYYICDITMSCFYNQYGIGLARDGTIYIPDRSGYMYAILNTDLDISLPLHNRKDYFNEVINFSAGISFNQPPSTYRISGNVTNSLGQNLEGVTISFIDTTDYETDTDSDGDYSQNVDPDIYNTIASLLGNTDQSASVDATLSDKTQDFVFPITIAPYDKAIRLKSRYLLED